MSSPYLQRGRRKEPAARSRNDAMAYLSRQQFFDTDRVKAFHQQLILTDTLREREEHVRENQRLAAAASEENKKFMEQLRRIQMADMEQEKQKANRHMMESRSVADFVKQQILQEEHARKQAKLDLKKAAKERLEIEKQYEKDMEMERQKDNEKKTNRRNVYTEQILTRKAMEAKEAKEEEMGEKLRRQIMEEKEKWNKMVSDMRAERQACLQWRKDIVAQMVASKVQDAQNKEQEDSNALARVVAQQEATHLQNQNEKKDNWKAMVDAMTAQREYKRKQQEQTEREEKQRGWQALQAMQELNRSVTENDQQVAQEKKEELKRMDDFRHQQISEKCARAEAERDQLLEFANATEEQNFNEDVQFNAYTTAIINAAAAAGKNINALRLAARKGIESVTGPIFGGVATDWKNQHSCSFQVSDYVRGATQEISRFYRAYDSYECTKSRLGFVW
ncbi:hypothetical protein JZ751_001648 [Albula glossodonta]|uniref:Trichohyalin-plectin-homology domain-containing protein n=1 Tax=Albula glossodonta TaxID=121402 RepID=A0A8T2PUB0_9TELE|nr:hypothetical protein JZ751_001648 [Albula glossodonta]